MNTNIEKTTTTECIAEGHDIGDCVDIDCPDKEPTTAKLNLYRVDDGGERHWIIARSEEDAANVFSESIDSLLEVEKSELNVALIPDEEFVTIYDGATKTTKTAGDCVAAPRRGVIASTCEYGSSITSKARPGIERSRASRASRGRWFAIRGGAPSPLLRTSAGKRRDREEQMRRKFEVEMTFMIEVDDALLASVDTAEWRDSFYNLTTAEEVAEHLGYNLMRGASLASLDGFADQPADAAEITSTGADNISAREIK